MGVLHSFDLSSKEKMKPIKRLFNEWPKEPMKPQRANETPNTSNAGVRQHFARGKPPIPKALYSFMQHKHKQRKWDAWGGIAHQQSQIIQYVVFINHLAQRFSQTKKIEDTFGLTLGPQGVEQKTVRSEKSEKTFLIKKKKKINLK